MVVVVVGGTAVVGSINIARATPWSWQMNMYGVKKARPRGVDSCANIGSLLLVMPFVPVPMTIDTVKDAITMRRT